MAAGPAILLFRVARAPAQPNPSAATESLTKRAVIAQHAGSERFTPHQCRHSAATDFARLGLPPHLITEDLNRSSLDVTMRYVRTSGSALSEWLTTRARADSL